jgi:hypothetical protein
MSLTIIIPNRDRDLATVKRSLDSVAPQLQDGVQLKVVDYGSAPAYQLQLQDLIATYKNVALITCPTQGQLWNKSRCINMVLKTCATTHFMVCDMDMLWHPQFIETHLAYLPQDQAIYFTVGVMTQEESVLEKSFENYAIKFQTNYEATGITVFPTALLLSINGFDEFYHGWGSEDADAHMRLKNAGYEVRFRESEVYFKHQWHVKNYRSSTSSLPFHPFLERINHRYFTISKSLCKTKANTQQPWGVQCDLGAYAKLEFLTQVVELTAIKETVHALTQVLQDLEHVTVLQLEITADPQAKTLKTQVKKALNKKTPGYMTLEQVNEHLLEHLILKHRNSPYSYSFDRHKGSIKWVIHVNTGS